VLSKLLNPLLLCQHAIVIIPKIARHILIVDEQADLAGVIYAALNAIHRKTNLASGGGLYSTYNSPEQQILKIATAINHNFDINTPFFNFIYHAPRCYDQLSVPAQKRPLYGLTSSPL